MMYTATKRPRLISLLLGLALALTLDATAQDRTCLWRITGDHNHVDLLGSIHALPPGAWPLPPAMERAFESADRVVFEADLGETVEAGLLVLQRAALPRETTLARVVPPTLHARLGATVRALGGDPQSLERSKPWFVALTLTSLELQAAGYDASDGIDLRLWQRAVREGKNTAGLETLAHQIEIMDGFSMDEQIELLRQTLDEIDQVRSELGRLTQMWRTGRAEALASTLSSTFKASPHAYRRLVVERNEAWLPKIEALTHGEGNVLVVVGVLHLVGPDGLVQALRSHGLLVIQQ